ncbi:unnamed protein product [Leuciscus chuanchicus]
MDLYGFSVSSQDTTDSLLMLFAKFRPTCFHKAAEIPSGSNRSPEVPPMQSLLEVCASFPTVRLCHSGPNPSQTSALMLEEVDKASFQCWCPSGPCGQELSCRGGGGWGIIEAKRTLKHKEKLSSNPFAFFALSPIKLTLSSTAQISEGPWSRKDMDPLRVQATDRKYMFVGILGSEKPENVLVLLIPYPCQGRGKIVLSSLSDPLSQAKKHALILRWSLATAAVFACLL